MPAIISIFPRDSLRSLNSLLLSQLTRVAAILTIGLLSIRGDEEIHLHLITSSPTHTCLHRNLEILTSTCTTNSGMEPFLAYLVLALTVSCAQRQRHYALQALKSYPQNSISTRPCNSPHATAHRTLGQGKTNSMLVVYIAATAASPGCLSQSDSLPVISLS